MGKGNDYTFTVVDMAGREYKLTKSMHDSKSAALFALSAANRGIVVPVKYLDRGTKVAVPGHSIHKIYFNEVVK
ncbi:MAG: hypothetical protein ACYTBJ_00610 [Planctomycetota bacterium]|jgi:hypothetical protein